MTDRPPYVPHAWETVDCPFCRSSERKLLERFGDKLQYTYQKCRQCGLIYHTPRPRYDEQFLQDAYGKYFMYNPDFEYTNEVLAEFIDEAEEISRMDRELTCLLEIGTSMGAFLKAAIPYYKDAEGLEISEQMAHFTMEKLGVKVYQKQFEEFQTDKKYSCIHMSHVIEHIPNPNAWMLKASELLTPQGILVICVPNMNSVGRVIKRFLQRSEIRKGKWKEAWRTPDHLFEPTIGSMKFLAAKHHFKILSYYSYSRKDPVARKPLGRLMQRCLKIGSNLRFYLQKNTW